MENGQIRRNDIIWKVIYSWRFILLFALISSLVLTGLKYTIDMSTFTKAQNQKISEESSSEKLSLEELWTQLTDREATALKEAQYIQNQIEEKEEYKQNSIYINLDPYAENSISLLYYIDTNYIININNDILQDNVSALREAYVSYINCFGIQEGLQKAIDWDIEDAYINELVRVKDVSSENTQFVVYVSGADMDQAVELAEEVAKLIQAYQPVLEEKIGEHDLILIDSYRSIVIDESLASKRNDLDNSIVSLQKNLDKLIAEFSDAQLRILQQGEEDITDQAINETINSKEARKRPGISKKFIILGILIGLFVGCGLIILQYIFSGRMRSIDELQKIYGIRIFGIMAEKEKKKPLAFVDHLLDKVSHKENWTLQEQRELILTNLKVTCKKENIKKIFVTSSLHVNEKERSLIEHLLSGLKESGIEVKFGENVMRNSKSFEQMADIGNVVIIEEENVSKYRMFEKEISLCMEQSAAVLGVIGLR